MTSLHEILHSRLQNNSVIAKQHDIGVLRITGPDAKKLLQGQTTCDMNKLSDDCGLYGAICSIKGRIVSSFYLVQHHDEVLMIMAKDLVEKTLLHLKKYAVFFKTELVNEEDAFAVYAHITSSSTETTQATLAERLPVTQNDQNITLTLGHHPLEVKWLIRREENQADYPAIEEKHSQLAGLSMLAARPLITLAQSDTLLPQWLNMQSTGGISFTKGCYTGQEIVARMQYRGKSKKQLALVTWQGQLDTTKDLLDEQGKSIGQVFSATYIEETGFAFVIINIEPSEAKALILDEQDVTLLALPYTVGAKN